MEPIYYVISILGCADGSAQCVPAATMPTRYETEAVCRAEQTNALLAASDLDFPALVAQCTAVRQRPASAEEKMEKLQIALKS